jgi:hypothetical protein
MAPLCSILRLAVRGSYGCLPTPTPPMSPSRHRWPRPTLGGCCRHSRWPAAGRQGSRQRSVWPSSGPATAGRGSGWGGETSTQPVQPQAQHVLCALQTPAFCMRSCEVSPSRENQHPCPAACCHPIPAHRPWAASPQEWPRRRRWQRPTGEGCCPRPRWPTDGHWGSRPRTKRNWCGPAERNPGMARGAEGGERRDGGGRAAVPHLY